ncbi:MAG: DNA repair ATPase [Actinomycetota bacterium]
MTDGAPSEPVATGTYDLLLSRLTAAAEELATRAESLNRRRTEAFGSSTLEVIATNRVRTATAVVPRDVAAVGDQLLLGYNAPVRATGEMRPEDVFGVHGFSFSDGDGDGDGSGDGADGVDGDGVGEPRGGEPGRGEPRRGEPGRVPQVDIAPNPGGLADSVLDDERFRSDFAHLFTYYKQARLQQLYRAGDKLLAVFRTARSATSLVVMRWQITHGRLYYVDDKGDRDHRFLPPTELTWTAAGRDDNLDGEFFLVADRVLLSPRRGKVRIMLDDGTAGHRPLLEETVEREQTLEDCALAYTVLGDLVLLRLRPYTEEADRYYVVNLLVDSAVRLDAIGAAFRELPNRQGLIFPSGVYLRTGEERLFDFNVEGMELQEIVTSPNGEDVLYVFHENEGGRSILLPYNLVRQDVVNPIWCHGHCLFDDGRMVVFREEAEPVTVHPIQVWDTPFCSAEYYASQPHDAGPLNRIGNADLVSGIGDALALRRLIRDVAPSTATFADVISQAGRVLDTHQHWYASSDVGDLAAPTRDVRTVAEEIIGQFEQVQEIRAAAAAELDAAATEQQDLIRALRQAPPATAAAFIATLSEIRIHLGRLLTLRDQREIDTDRLDGLVGSAEEQLATVAAEAAEHLASDGAFAHYGEQFDALTTRLGGVTTAAEAGELLAETDQVAADLDLVTATVGDLEIDNLPVRTAVLEQVAQVAAGLNQVRGRIEARHDTLVEAEHGAAFTTELGLLAQALTTSLARVDTPEECDDTLTRLLGQLEALETAAPRTEAQLAELAARRDQVEETIGAKRQRLVEDRLRLADQLASAARRNIDRLASRAAELTTAAEVAGFFAADPAAQRARSLIDQLRELGEAVRADELQSALGRAGDDAQRALRDRLELYDGDQVRFGEHRFSVDARARNLTITPVGDGLEAALTGTDLRIPLDDPALTAHRDRWNDPLPSETPQLYRSAFLAAELFANRRADVVAALAAGQGARTAEATDRALLDLVHAEMADRLDEGYDRGVHDLDTVRLLVGIASAAADAGPLLTPGPTRAAAMLAWFEAHPEGRARWEARGRALAEVDADTTELAAAAAADFAIDEAAATYLLVELARIDGAGGLRFGVEKRVDALAARLRKTPAVAKARTHLLGGDRPDVAGLRSVMADLVAAGADDAGLGHAVPELSALVCLPDVAVDVVGDVELTIEVDGLIGRHPTVVDGRFEGRIDELLDAAAAHRRDVVPSHKTFSAERRRAIAEVADTLRLDDIEPRVPEGFVRNRLITDVYLPLIGANLVRQIGGAGDTTGQRSGLLMLLSPPGYGKTTLVDYLADRLGMALVKISGPSLGHDVTSLDPGQAPNAAARQELERINMAFALGTNVMLYVDDIQHTSPELLQRFISLCDAQRRIDGVWQGAPTTFDLRGKRFAVVMAGNPYTESGERFRIPDMLANRADTFNLGDVVGGENGELFALSYLENSLTANPVSAVLAGRERADIELFLRAAAGEPLDESRLSHPYSSAEVADIVALLGHLRAVQEVVLAVNRQYIASAATDADYRTEPAFLLQGSYRNMVRMAARLLPAMTAAEVAAVIDDHYQAEAQSLTGDAEANLLRLADLRGVMTDDRRLRWEEILEVFGRQQRLGRTDDPAIQAAGLVADAIGKLAERP